MARNLRSSKAVDIACPFDPEKLNDDQAEQYLRRLWILMGKEKAKHCLYIDPLVIKDYHDNRKGREKVLRCMMKDKFFEKRYVFFPICLWNHWVLMVFCNPCNDLEVEIEKPTLILLDSLKNSEKKNVIEFIHGMLVSLYKFANINCSLRTVKNIPVLIPEVPNQNDDKSCGFFMLFYVTMFLKMCPPVFWTTEHYPSFMTKNWFSNKQIKEFRKSLLGIFSHISMFDCSSTEDYTIKKSKADVEIDMLIESFRSNSCYVHHNTEEKQKKRKKGQTTKLEVVENKVHDVKKKRKLSTEVTEREDIEREAKKSVEQEDKILIKLSPSLFTNLVQNLTESQREWVISTGFGCILDFNLNSYPKYLGYSLVNSFVSDDCSLVLDKRTIRITDQDVNRIIGLPLGSIPIPFVNSQQLSKEWRKHFRNNDKSFRVGVKDVLDAIKDSSRVDLNFKKNFILVLICFLIQPPSNSYIRQNFLGICCDFDKCFQYNWCELVVRYLKESSKVWLRNIETRFYTGSLSFLLYFFLDTFIGRKAFHGIPSPRYVSWNSYNLDVLEELMIQKSCIKNGELSIPAIDYSALESCQKKCLTDPIDHEDDDSSIIPEKEKEIDSYSRKLFGEPEMDNITKDPSVKDTVDNQCKASAERHNDQGKLSVLESLLESYKTLQQAFLLQMSCLKNEMIEDVNVERIRREFINMNDTANKSL